MIRVLVVDDAPLTLGNIRRLLAAEPEMELCGNAIDGESALASVRKDHPDVVLIDMDLQRGEGLRTAQAIASQMPEIAVVVMGLDDDDTTLRRVAETGARDYLPKPFGGDELLETIRQVVEAAAAGLPASGPSHRALPADAPLGAAADAAATDFAAAMRAAAESLAPAAAPRPPASAMVAVPAANADRQVIAIVSGKGGVGTSVLAANIALMAANEARRRVAIVDLDLQHGDLRRMLRVDSPQGIMDVAHASPVADRQAVLPRLIDGPAKVMALLAPAMPALESSLAPEFVANLLLQMRALAEIVVVDLPAHVGPESIAALRAADRIVLVSSMSDPGVRATQGMLKLMTTLGIPTERVLVTLNRTEANSDLTKPAVEEALGRHVPVQLPYDPILVSTSINRGAPFVLQKPDAQVSRKVRELASLLFPMPEHADAPAPKREERRPVPVPAGDEEDEEGGGRKRGKKKRIFSLMRQD